MTVLGLVDRRTGQSRMFHVDKGGAQIHSIVLGNIARDFSLIMLGVFLMIGGGMYLLHRVQKRRMSTPPVNAATVVTPPR